ADAGAVVDLHPVSGFRQIGGRADADDARADDGDVVSFPPVTGRRPLFAGIGNACHVGAAPHLAAVILSPFAGRGKPCLTRPSRSTASAVPALSPSRP